MTEGTLKVDDISALAEPFLTEKTKQAVAKKSTGLLVVENGVVTHQCVYIGYTVDINDMESGIKSVAAKINDLGEKDLIHSALGNFIKFDLVPEIKEVDGEFKRVQKTVVLCYVLVPQATYEEIMKEPSTYGSFSEGGVPGAPD